MRLGVLSTAVAALACSATGSGTTGVSSGGTASGAGGTKTGGTGGGGASNLAGGATAAGTSADGGTGVGGALTTGGTAGTAGTSGVGGTGGASGGTGGASGSLPWLKVAGNQIQIEATGQQVILRGVSVEGLGSLNSVRESGTETGIRGAIDYLTNTNDTSGSSPGWYPTLLRLPVDTPNPEAEIDALLKPAVDYATQKRLYAIVDLHYVANPYTNDATVRSFWTRVAPMFKDYPNVIYEPFNESNQQDSWATYKPTMQKWVDLIRGFAPKNLIFAGSPSWDQAMGDAATNPLTGGNIVYVVHMYEQHYYSAWNRQQVEQCAAVHPVVMTEWGFNHETSQPGYGTNIIGSYGDPMLTWLEALGGSWTAWCASDSWLPRMFTNSGGWVLRTGQDNMGGFVKDWLYTHRNDKAPF